ncbi:MAG: DUF2281 domain-containing protein [Oscillospiraceae bacterium]|nr:DUF2281 domain-containing protein [Oscillospiraceae bacterium]
MSIKEQLINDIETLPENVLLAINNIIKEWIALNNKNSNDIGEKRRAMFGCMKGKMWIADDFDAPLEEMRKYME